MVLVIVLLLVLVMIVVLVIVWYLTLWSHLFHRAGPMILVICMYKYVYVYKR